MENFGKWFRNVMSKPWGKVSIIAWAVVSLAVPNFVKWAFDNLTSITFDYYLFALFSSMVLTTLAMALLIPVGRLFDQEVFESRLEGFQGKGNLFGVMNLNAKERKDKGGHAAVVNKGVINAMLYQYGTVFFLYIVLIIKHLYGDRSDFLSAFLEVSGVALNLVSSWIFLAVYYRITYYEERDRNEYERKLILVAFVFFALTVWLSFVQEGCVFANSNTNLLIHAISGLLMGVSFALFIAKLDSAIIKTPTYLLMLMFLYGIFQGMYLLFAKINGGNPFEFMKDFVIWSCLILKGVFFALMMWIFQTNRLTIHVMFSSAVDEKVDNDTRIISGLLNEAIDEVKEKKGRNS
jgi:hypothetical protein